MTLSALWDSAPGTQSTGKTRAASPSLGAAPAAGQRKPRESPGQVWEQHRALSLGEPPTWEMPETHKVPELLWEGLVLHFSPSWGGE